MFRDFENKLESICVNVWAAVKDARSAKSEATAAKDTAQLGRELAEEIRDAVYEIRKNAALAAMAADAAAGLSFATLLVVGVTALTVAVLLIRG